LRQAWNGLLLALDGEGGEMTRHENHLSCDADGCNATVLLRDANMSWAHLRGWDWYTQYNPKTRHFCPKHVGQCKAEIALCRARKAPLFPEDILDDDTP